MPLQLHTQLVGQRSRGSENVQPVVRLTELYAAAIEFDQQLLNHHARSWVSVNGRPDVGRLMESMRRATGRACGNATMVWCVPGIWWHVTCPSMRADQPQSGRAEWGAVANSPTADSCALITVASTRSTAGW